ncbi:MAG: DUF924 domain-containing protein [Comamonadaceae bacterium]|nr:MAG: DUF924 domain-containing protein [Comamonadaceae bacterium]
MTPASNSPANSTPSPEAAAVLEFWLADGVTLDWPSQDLGKVWFGNDLALDGRIREKFGPLVDEALSGGLKTWENDPLQRLALIILLDQFTRNLFRGKAEAFAGDARTQQLTMDAVERGWDHGMTCAARVFLYMPLMHAEDLALQQECVIRFAELHDEAPEAVKKNIQGSLEFAEKHRDIVAIFGRFPHRNAALGRTDTVEEREFLVTGPRFGQ